jgi:hypothetical protein
MEHASRLAELVLHTMDGLYDCIVSAVDLSSNGAGTE